MSSDPGEEMPSLTFEQVEAALDDSIGTGESSSAQLPVAMELSVQNVDAPDQVAGPLDNLYGRLHKFPDLPAEEELLTTYGVFPEEGDHSLADFEIHNPPPAVVPPLRELSVQNEASSRQVTNPLDNSVERGKRSSAVADPSGASLHVHKLQKHVQPVEDTRSMGAIASSKRSTQKNCVDFDVAIAGPSGIRAKSSEEPPWKKRREDSDEDIDGLENSSANVLHEKLEVVKRMENSRASLELRCEICFEQFNSTSRLHIHLGEREGIVCDVPRCKRQFCNRKAYEEHRKEAHFPNWYFCNECGNHFNNRKTHQNHQCNDIRQFKCDFCPKTFISTRALVHHRKYHVPR